MSLILLVEDDESMLRAYSLQFKALGYEVITAINGGQALSYLRHGYKPDLIITDYQMPILNGLLLTEEIREKGSTTPIIMWSHDSDIKQHALGAGANDFFDKSCAVESLFEMVRKLINK